MHAVIADYLTDILQNAWQAGSTDIQLELVQEASMFSCTIRDNGCGMNEAGVQQALDPFWSDGKKHPGRKVGLGLPFLSQACTDVGGAFSIVSARGEGTTVSFSFPLAHIDCPPIGNLQEAMVQAFCLDGDFELTVVYRRPHANFVLKRSELLAALGDLASAGSIVLLRQYLESMEDSDGENES